MNPDRLKQIEDLYHAALERTPAERADFVKDACGGDEPLREEVTSLLAHHGQSEFMGRPAVEAAAEELSREDEPIAVGTKLGSYRILSLLGKGGMGEVYRVRDARLGREVAIKVLPPSLALNPDRVRRFEREARLLASLNHPNIAAIHGLEEWEGRRFLVLELVEGETLGDRIQRGKIPVEEVLQLALQIVEALEAAHEKGVIHRDLKPANIKVTPDGKVKVLDFGLGKALGGEASKVDLSASPTLSMTATQQGVLLGTAAYMSPEQTRGGSVDKRTDVWSFGCCLYEALTGKAAFLEDTVSDTLAKILKQEPDWSALPEDLYPGVQTLLSRCLQKDLRRRLRDIGDAGIELGDAANTIRPSSVGLSSELNRTGTPRLQHAVVLLATVIATAAVTWALIRPSAPNADLVTRSMIPLAPGATFERVPSVSNLAIAPDGRHFAYVARQGETTHLYLRTSDQMTSARVSGSEGAIGPFFSPDSQWLAFWSAGALMKVSVTGGAPVALGGSGFGGGAWGTDGWILFSPTSGMGLWRVSSNGGSREHITTPDRARAEKSHRGPHVLPGSRAALFTLGKGDQASFDDAAIGVLSLETGEYRVLVDGGMDPHYSPTGHVIYARDGILFALPFDPDALEVRGTPVPVIRGVMTSFLHGHAEFDLSENGSLLFARGASWKERNRVLFVDRQGQTTSTLDDGQWYRFLRFSGDGRSAMLIVEEGASSTMWRFDLSRRTMTRFESTFDNMEPDWSPDGDRVVFASNREFAYNLFQMPTDGSEPPERLTESENSQRNPSWSPDGTVLLFDELNPDTGRDLWFLSSEAADSTPEPFVRTEFNEGRGRFSPDGHWVAYQSDETGQNEIYIQRFPGPGRKFQVSVGGGTRPRWNQDGRELFYLNGNRLVSLEVELGPEVQLQEPRQLLQMSSALVDYDVTADGQQFALIEDFEIEPPPPAQLTLVQNWFQELRELVPVN